MLRLLKRVIGIAVVLVAVVVICATVLGTKERPVPEQLAGFHETTVAVPHRAAPLPVYIWYPAQSGGSVELIAQNALFFGHHVRRDAPPAQGEHPVVMLSHGSGGNARQLGWIASELALRGNIVIGTDHPGTTSGDSDPFQTIRIWERPADISRLLDHVLMTPPMGLNPDETQVGVLGFSLGGHTALALSGVRVAKRGFIDYCVANAGLFDCGWMQGAGVDFATIDAPRYEASMKDPRIKLTVAVDPALTKAIAPDGLADFDNPALIVNLGEPALLPQAIRADALADDAPNAEYEYLPQTWHFAFLAECSVLGRIVIGLVESENICSDADMRDRKQVHAELVPLISDWFGRPNPE